MTGETMCRDIETGELLWKKPLGWVALFATSNGELVGVTNKAVFMDPRTGIKRREVDLPFLVFGGVQFDDRSQLSGDGSWLLVLERSSDGRFREVKKVDLSTGKAVLVFQEDKWVDMRIFMSRDGKRALILGESVQYWDLEKNVLIGSFQIPVKISDKVLQSFTADHELSKLALLYLDKETLNSLVVVWDVKQMKPLCDFMQDQIPGGKITFSPAGGELMLAGGGYNSDGSQHERNGPDLYEIANAIVIFDWKRGLMLRTIAFPWPDTAN